MTNPHKSIGTNHSSIINSNSMKPSNKKVRVLSHARLGLTLIFGSALMLSACSNRTVITTSDDSAEYKSARSLAPLHKRTAEERAIQIPDFNGVDEQADASSTKVLVTTSSSDVQPSILTQGEGVKLMLNSGLDTSWEYLTTKLAGSEVTVFSRNKTAGRIAIGCAEIGIEAVEIKPGRWSILNRKVNRASEYCSLQAVEQKGSTLVSVLDRTGQEASANDARFIFDRILK